MPYVESIKSIWKDNLDSRYFFDESPIAYLKAKEDFSEQGCRKALTSVDKILKKEGPNVALLNFKRKTFVCLREFDKAEELGRAIEELSL